MVAEVQESETGVARSSAGSRGCVQMYVFIIIWQALEQRHFQVHHQVLLHPLQDPNLSLGAILVYRRGFSTHLVVATWNDSCFQWGRKATSGGRGDNTPIPHIFTLLVFFKFFSLLPSMNFLLSHFPTILQCFFCPNINNSTDYSNWQPFYWSLI